MAPVQSAPGSAQRRFHLVTTLLSLIDPVRGEPTTHGLDKHPHESVRKEHTLLKKFLDSFAWICSTSKNGATTSAVAIEQNGPTGTVLRLARNTGISDDLIQRLQQLLDELAAIAVGESTPRQKEAGILRQIVDLDYEGILSLTKKLARPDVRKQIVSAINGSNTKSDDSEEFADTDFETWTHNLLPLTSLDPTPSREELVAHIKWASRARWKYSEQLEELFCPPGQNAPWWFNDIYKLGRYYVAAKCMMQAAAKLQNTFASIHVLAVEAPEQQRFTLYNDRAPLSGVLQKLTDLDHPNLVTELGKAWTSDKPEQYFRKHCKLTLTVHAEMQLLSFYDHQPELVPSLKFMGTSKKACYLCHEFLTRHASGMTVSASHQKLYPSWMPPPCSNSAVKRRHKHLLWDLSRHLEETVARDLETRLGIRRDKSLDSTAGHSMPTTESQVLPDGLRYPVIRQAATHIDDDFLGDNDSLQGETISSQPFAHLQRHVYWA